MKKITTMVTALLVSGFGFYANAQDLGEGTAVTQSFSMLGGYVTSLAPSYATTLPTVLFAWGDNINAPTKITLVDPQESSTLIPGMPSTYAPVLLTLPQGGDPLTMQATLNQTGDMLSVNLLSAASAGFGEYIVTIPENTVQDANGLTNAETTYSVTYCAAGTPTLSPTSYQVAPADFTGATVSFNGLFEKFVVDDDAIVIRLIDNKTLALVKGWTPTDINVSENSFSVSFEGLDIQNGDQYNLQLIANTFTYIVDTSVYLNNQVSSNYLIFDGLEAAQIIDGPEYYTAPNFSPIMITWDWQNIVPVGQSMNVEAYYNNLTTGALSYITIPESAINLVSVTKPDGDGVVQSFADGEYNVLSIDLAPYITDIYGTQITLVIPEGVISNLDGKTNQQTKVEFTVFPLTDCEVIFEKENNDIYYLNWVIMNDLSYLNLNYYGPNEMYILNSEGDMVATIYNDPYGMYGYPTPGSFWLSGYSMLTGQPIEVYVDIEGNDLADGVYTLYLPEALFLLTVDGTSYLSSEYYSDEIIIGDGTTVVKNLNKDEESGYTVYNLNGVKVLEGTDASELSKLQNGIYIINGKKVLIRN